MALKMNAYLSFVFCMRVSNFNRKYPERFNTNYIFIPVDLLQHGTPKKTVIPNGSQFPQDLSVEAVLFFWRDSDILAGNLYVVTHICSSVVGLDTHT
jgi:hypothetical protein